MQNGQWSVETICRSFVRSACHMWSWWPSARERSGVEHTHFAPSNRPHSSLDAPSCSSSDRYRYCGHVSPNTFWPLSRAAASCSTACFALTCTTYSGAPVRFAIMIARCVASSSICQARAMPWKYGSVLPSSISCAASTSMTGPFSACIIVSSPVSRETCIALSTCASSE